MAECDFFVWNDIVMKEIWEISTQPYMLPLTVLLGLAVLFILVSVLIGVGSEAFDLDIDTDGEFSGGGIFHSLLQVVNADKIPTTMVVSILLVCMWTVSVMGNMLFNSSYDSLIGVLIVGVSFILGCVLTKFITMPLIPFFKLMKDGEDNGVKVIGMEAKVKTGVVSDSFGQVLVKGGSEPVLLNARLREGEKELHKGDSVVVLERSEDGKFFYVAKLKI